LAPELEGLSEILRNQGQTRTVLESLLMQAVRKLRELRWNLSKKEERASGMTEGLKSMNDEMRKQLVKQLDVNRDLKQQL